MALINCPECGKEVSDKAISCPNCGYVINSPLPYYSYRKTYFFQKKKFWIIFSACILIIAAGLFGYKKYTDYLKEQTILEEIQMKKEYHTNMLETFDDIIGGVQLTTTLHQKLSYTWKNELDSAPQITSLNYKIIENMYATPDFSDDYNKLKDIDSKIKENMDALEYPPLEYINEYNSLKKFYESYDLFSFYILFPDALKTTTYAAFIKNMTSAINECSVNMDIALSYLKKQ